MMEMRSMETKTRDAFVVLDLFSFCFYCASTQRQTARIIFRFTIIITIGNGCHKPWQRMEYWNSYPKARRGKMRWREWERTERNFRCRSLLTAHCTDTGKRISFGLSPIAFVRWHESEWMCVFGFSACALALAPALTTDWTQIYTMPIDAIRR